MRIEAIKGLVYMRKWDIAKQLDQSRKVMNLARTCRDLRSETVAAATAANACLRLGATNDGLEHLSRLLDLAERLRDKLLIFYGFKLKTIYCTALAMWNDAKAFYDRLAELSPVPSPVDIARHACMEADLGHDDEARRLFFEAMNVDETSYGAVHCAEILIRTGDKSYLELAKKHLRIVEDNLGLDILGASAETRRFCHAAAIVAYFERDVAAANGVFDRMKSIPVSPQPWGGGVLEYVYLTHGKFTKAIGLFDRSIAKCRESRFVVREGWDRFFRAEAFVRRDKPGDLETAIKDLGDLVEHCRRHGLVLLESRIEGLLSSASGNRHAGAAKPGISHPDGLTNRARLRCSHWSPGAIRIKRSPKRYLSAQKRSEITFRRYSRKPDHRIGPRPRYMGLNTP